ncbi:MAG: T9SS type A sorting domain-containing protein [Saprospiraceae bacterium]
MTKILFATVIQQYIFQFDDRKPVAGDNYYRLKMVDLDGSTKYSNILLINRVGEDNLVFNLYPNPVADVFQYQFSVPEGGAANIRIVNLAGKLIYEENQTALGGLILEGRFNVGHLPAGIYLFQMTNGESVQVERFVVE